MTSLSQWTTVYKLRLKRRRLLWRGFRARHGLSNLVNRTSAIRPKDILCVAVVRNEAQRLPYFLHHHRSLGVQHFLIVDNGSTDGTPDFLMDQPDVSVWETDQSYRDSRFGLDWAMWLLMRYGHGHWCLTLDADELLIYPKHDTCDLRQLTGWMDQTGRVALQTIMLDMYPAGPVQDQVYDPGQHPARVLTQFDAWGYWVQRQMPMGNLWLQGGPRARCFFADRPERAPTLNKIPLVKWSRRFAYVNSTHSALPRRLNGLTADDPTGVLLHTKFLPEIVEKSREEKQRRQHFGAPEAFDDYYDSVIGNPDLRSADSQTYEGWQKLETLGLMQRGAWV
jgi:hypothetical protein